MLEALIEEGHIAIRVLGEILNTQRFGLQSIGMNPLSGEIRSRHCFELNDDNRRSQVYGRIHVISALNSVINKTQSEFIGGVEGELMKLEVGETITIYFSKS